MIISRIGRKSFKVQALYGFIYAFLIIGSLTMVYPFMLMISGSTKSAVDIKYFDAFPRFLIDDVWLYRKHVEGEMNEDVIEMNETYDNDIVSFEFLSPPETVHPDLVKEMRAFLKQQDFPFYYYTIGYLETPTSRTIASNLRKFKDWLRKKYGNDIHKINSLLDTEYLGWSMVVVKRERYRNRREKPAITPFFLALAEFKKTIPIGLKYYFSPEGYFKKEFLKPQYGKDIKEYNKIHGTHYGSYHELHLSREFPVNAPEKVKEDWKLFVREVIGLHFVKLDKGAEEVYREFLGAKYSTIKNFNKYYNTRYKSFGEIKLPYFAPLKEGGIRLTDWEMFLAGWKDPVKKRIYQAPITSIHIYSPEFLFQDYLKQKYGNIDNLNRKLKCKFASFADILLPQQDNHYLYMIKNKNALRWEFCTRNYKAVAEYIIFHGRGVFNTVVYCLLQILCALTVNPLAAYAMSRYKMPSSYKILLFLLCTMAFPPMVTGIPNFLMLRKLGLLNTFAALILPGMANGYAIFLLKGFFDSQPKELYECAQLDGANEWILFWHIAMSLSKPILAVIALQAFTLAYSNFMFAFVVCQDKKMWTLMVWLYQLQQERGQAVMYASLIIAAIPTFLIFLFCQNIIMRGIVVPSEK